MSQGHGRSPLQRLACPSQERKEWSGSVSCKEPAGRSYAHSLPDFLMTSTVKEPASAVGDSDVHSSRVARQLHSPTLMRLRSGSAAESSDNGRRGRATRLDSNIEAKQRVLASKHLSAKSRAGQVAGAGGGITIWPGMDDMRLSQRETVQLTAAAFCLIVGSVCLFMYLHGALHWHNPLPPHTHRHVAAACTHNTCTCNTQTHMHITLTYKCTERNASYCICNMQS